MNEAQISQGEHPRPDCGLALHPSLGSEQGIGKSVEREILHQVSVDVNRREVVEAGQGKDEGARDVRCDASV